MNQWTSDDNGKGETTGLRVKLLVSWQTMKGEITLKTTRISKPVKNWWAGDSRVEEFMPPVAEAIKKYHKWPSDEFTSIYNKAYEAVYAAIKKYADEKEAS